MLSSMIGTMTSSAGLNRYMVECKWGRFSNNHGERQRLNRYMVECKFIKRRCNMTEVQFK